MNHRIIDVYSIGKMSFSYTAIICLFYILFHLDLLVQVLMKFYFHSLDYCFKDLILVQIWVMLKVV
jgi:hypothetical protein